MDRFEIRLRFRNVDTGLQPSEASKQMEISLRERVVEKVERHDRVKGQIHIDTWRTPIIQLRWYDSYHLKAQIVPDDIFTQNIRIGLKVAPPSNAH
jgi:hypothetical protein